MLAALMAGGAAFSQGAAPVVLRCPGEAAKDPLCEALRAEIEIAAPGRLRSSEPTGPALVITLIVTHRTAREVEARVDWTGPAHGASGSGPPVMATVADAPQLGRTAMRSLARGILEVSGLPL
ncbi:MAG: hypothetical protein ACK4KW_14330 [Gemmobacter sp.]